MFTRSFTYASSGLVLAALGCLAYLHAHIAGQVIAMQWLTPSMPMKHDVPAHSQSSSKWPAEAFEASLVRNKFDSSRPTPAPHPLEAPRCPGVIATATAESRDRLWSVAALRNEGEARARLRRVGDDVAGRVVSFIGFNPREESPAVWLSRGDELCQVLLFQPPDSAPSIETARATSQLWPEIGSGIRKLSDSEFKVERRALDAILRDQALLMNGVRIVPERQSGSSATLRVLGVRAGTLLAELGLKSGDRLESINGFAIANPEQALEAYARLRVAPKLHIVGKRGGAPFEIDYLIE